MRTLPNDRVEVVARLRDVCSSTWLVALAACTSTTEHDARTPAAAPVTSLPARAAPSESSEASLPEVRTLVWQPGVKNAYPRWSKDGKSILFQSNRAGKWQLFVMDADGSSTRALTHGEANDNFPDWSPDNTSIAFVSDRDGDEEIYVMRADGTGARNLSSDPARDIHPYWSPDGKSILFNSTRDATRLQIYEVSADGTGLHRLVTSPDDDTCARVGPSGDRFIYLANLAIGQDDVMMRRRDGSDPVNLTHDAVPDGWPTWTPDGKHIVYSSAASGTFCLYLMNSDGTERRQLTAAELPYQDARACVSFDGKHIVFNRDRGDTIGICVIELSSAVGA
jgi:dipeptidyl aminopeptidase/acylaminoacyl peptidase